MGKENKPDNRPFRREKENILEMPRPSFPKRAVITGGMPYGNKTLHFGHVGGVFVQADVLARFLRDRIGKENVIFVSGTDCYGSPIVESYRSLCEKGEFSGSIEDFVRKNHESQKQTLKEYNISLNLFAASGLDEAKVEHKKLTDILMQMWYENGYLEKMVTRQFYDAKAGQFLNGRQVVGKCPVENCNSDKGYADECSMGHQYMPEELIDPKSTLTGETPEMRDVTNWYIDLTRFQKLMEEYVEDISGRENVRPLVANTIREFMTPPMVYIKNELYEDYEKIKDQMPAHTLNTAANKTSFSLEFQNLKERDAAREVLNQHDIRFRAGKTLVPFRLTGNIAWGVPAPVIEGEEGLTIWVWPESLWAPISFTRTYLKQQGFDEEEWKKFWCSEDAEVFQFIGQDNIYFYGIAEMVMFMATQGKGPLSVHPKDGQLTLPTLVANNHILFLNKKASSSGAVKPPMAEELLDYYTAEQLRAHFLGLGLGLKSVSFQPKPLNPTAGEKDADPVLKEGKLLSNVFNRVARSCFYTAQKYNNGMLPLGEISEEVLKEGKETILKYERYMYRFEFHSVMSLMDTYIRNANKYWAKHIAEADKADDNEARQQVLRDVFHMVRVAAVLMHPIAPEGTELLLDYLGFGEEFWDWNRIFDTLYDFCGGQEHQLKFLEPRFDFFPMHQSQIG
ncbi:methionine--tRNA ligase [Ructibacterium gallinarum]|uniref:Class I tRNA ligase family protein n=1 Tax=Ructibacterium gallinarum TaxID=2779355 RepID=A0A9D5R894_9FIRM|nr:class I tRNA ligase family protein [Ructibacterium gallinarum]MBE5040181.1 class I tRNA ligase family protein [Ructibacterium gallinarum]